MHNDEPYQILPLPGFAPEVGRIVSMMDRARERTLKAVENLNIEQVDHLHDPASNSIGTLLAHIAAVERIHAIDSFEQRAPTSEEMAKWSEAFGMGDAGRQKFRGRDLASYLTDLESVRSATKDRMRDLPNDWLYEKRPYVGGKQANNLYIWYHVMEDEINHRGQISWLRKRLPN